MSQVRLVVAEDHPLTIAGLRMVIDTQSDWILCAEISNGAHLTAEIGRTNPHVVVLDLGLPGRTGLDLLLELSKLPTKPKTIVLSGQEQPLAYQRALDAGADAVLTKSDPPQLLVDAVRAVLANERFVSPLLADRLEPTSRDHDAQLSLTARERDVLRFMSLGMPTKEIGRELNISPATAKKHRENLMRKLGESTAVATVRKARRLGLVSE